MAGWIKLHRSIDEWEWSKDPKTFRVWLYFLTHARHDAGSWQGITLEAGQLVVGRKSVTAGTGVTEQSYKTAMKRLERSGAITTKSTNKYTLVTITNWGFYQRDEERLTSKTTSTLTNNQPASNQQVTTNKNEKNSKKAKNVVEEVCAETTTSTIVDLLKYYGFPSAPYDEECAVNLIDEYSAEWFYEALKRASEQQQSARNWGYVKAIMREWKKQGYIDALGARNAAFQKTQMRFRISDTYEEDVPDPVGSWESMYG